MPGRRQKADIVPLIVPTSDCTLIEKRTQECGYYNRVTLL